MAVEPTLLGLPAVATGLLSLALGLVIYFARPDREQNRILAIYVATTGLAWALVRGARYLLTDPIDGYAVHITAFALWSISIYTYGAILASLDTPLTSPLRSRFGRAALILASVTTFTSAVFWPELWIGDVTLVVGADGVERWDYEAAVLGQLWLFAWVPLWLLASAAAIHAVLRSPSAAKRRQAAWFAAAFVAQDLILAAWLLALLVEAPLPHAFFVLMPAAGSFLNSVLLGYGILRAQVFDIDIKLKWTLSRGTMASVFVAVFFLVANAAQEFLAEELGWALGGIAAGALLLVISPLQRAAEGLASAALPGVAAHSEYASFRKLEVYKGALEEMLQDGALNDRDRAVLRRLRERLGLSESTCLAMESDLRGAAT